MAGLGSSKRPAVHVTINGYTYRGTVASMGGRFMLPVSAENPASAIYKTHGYQKFFIG